MMDWNDIIQWATVVAIVVIAIVVAVRKIRNFRRSVKDGKPQCGCGCSGCEKACDESNIPGKADKNKR